jgi:hypothetical protein
MNNGELKLVLQKRILNKKKDIKHICHTSFWTLTWYEGTLVLVVLNNWTFTVETPTDSNRFNIKY